MTSLPIGALFGALLGGTLAHQFGRKRILSIALLTLCNLSWCGTRTKCNILIICRCIMGFAIGMDSPVAFTFAEISNLKHKGRNVNYWQVVWYVAIVTSFSGHCVLYARGWCTFVEICSWIWCTYCFCLVHLTN